VFSQVPGRVRVAVRLRPRNAEESVADADFADCVELQPEVYAESISWFLFVLFILDLSALLENLIVLVCLCCS